MRRLNGIRGRALLALAAAATVAAPAASQQGGGLGVLGKLQPGLWKLRILGDTGSNPASVCIGDPTILAQLQHRNLACSRLVVARTPEGATVHYTCPSGGYGQTALRVETPRLVQIDTQGIADNRPFAYRAEARLVGSCSGGQSSGR